MANVISVDLGGTNTRIAQFTDLDRAEMVGDPIKRRNTHSYEEDLAWIIETALSMSGGLPIDALGIGVPGRVTDNKTDMVASNNLPEWANRNFCLDLSRVLKCPVYMDNDGVAAGLGEGYFGSTRSNFHYLVWGTGISGVSIGHTDKGISARYIRPDYKSHFDAWERDCGGAAILHKHGKPGEELTDDEWNDINTLFAHYLKGYIALAKPPAIIFGGGLAVRHAETITAHVSEMGVPIQISQFAGNSGLIGGLALVKRGVVSTNRS